MNRVAIAVIVALCSGVIAAAHGSGASITWNREISRIVYEKCASCHRPEGTAFSLMTYQDVQPRATAIKEAVLSRRMPPWGAIKGFGRFRNDESLTQEQIELVTKWVDGGIRRGNNRAMLPKPPEFVPKPGAPSMPPIEVRGPSRLERAVLLDGLMPETVPAGQSMQVVAVLPGGRVEPLVWLHGYEARYGHPFLLRRPILLPAGTMIRGLPADAVLKLIPA